MIVPAIRLEHVPSAARPVDSRAKALLAAQAALEKQAEDLAVLDLRALSTVTDFFVVCTVESSRQVAAIQEHIEAALYQHGCSVWHTEGAVPAAGTSRGFQQEPQWVLMDCGDVVVHLLDQRARAFYRLEELWADAPRLPLSSPASGTPDRPPARPGDSESRAGARPGER